MKPCFRKPTSRHRSAYLLSNYPNGGFVEDTRTIRLSLASMVRCGTQGDLGVRMKVILRFIRRPKSVAFDVMGMDSP